MKEPQIDLSKCKPGQKLKMRNGEICQFKGRTNIQSYPFRAGYCTYTKNGTVWLYRKSHADIIAVLPLKRPKSRPLPSPSKAAKASQSALKRDLLAIHKEMKAVMGKIETILNKS